MTTSLKKMLGRLPADRREKVEARAAELIAEEMTLRDLRKAPPAPRRGWTPR